MKLLFSPRRFSAAILLATLLAISVGAPFAAEAVTAPAAQGCQGTLCFRPPLYFLTYYKRLRFWPRDILISGVNFNHPVDCVANPRPIQFALRGNPLSNSPLTQFNQQYVAAQLAGALVPLTSVTNAAHSALSCYKLDFEPVLLSDGTLITPASTLAELFTACDVAAIQPPSEQRDADMQALAELLEMLNSTC